MSYWKNKVLPKIKKLFDKGKKKGAADVCKDFDKSKESLDKEIGEKTLDLHPKVVELYRSSTVIIKKLLKEPTEPAVKDNSDAVQSALGELAKAGFPGAQLLSEATVKYGIAYLPGPIVYLFQKTSTFLVEEALPAEETREISVEEVKPAEEPAKAEEPEIKEVSQSKAPESAAPKPSPESKAPPVEATKEVGKLEAPAVETLSLETARTPNPPPPAERPPLATPSPALSIVEATPAEPLPPPVPEAPATEPPHLPPPVEDKNVIDSTFPLPAPEKEPAHASVPPTDELAPVPPKTDA